MRYEHLVLGLVALAVAGTAQAAVTSIGGGRARACYEAARLDRSDANSIEVCNLALTEEALTQPDRIATHVNRGILHMLRRSFDAALRDYDAALRMNPDQAEAHVNKGIALLHRGGEAEAIAVLSKGIALNPESPEVAYYSRGVAHELSGDVNAAYRDYRQAAELKPDWQEPKTQLQRFQVVRKGG